MFFTSIYVYTSLPENVASHWNAHGQVDGYMPKFWGTFFLPLISVGLLGLLLGLPIIDPLRANFTQFQKYYDWFIVIIMGFFAYLQGLILIWNLGYSFPFTQLFILPIVILFLYIGVLLEHSEQNWFVGIRTPWTLSNEQVWKRTSHFGGQLFKLAGIVSGISILVPDAGIYLILIPTLVAGVLPIIYSYYVYRKLAS
jgi:uncharacterized membrane protein